LGSPIAEVEEVNILTPNEEQSPCIPKTNSLFQLFKQFFSTHQFQALHISFLFVGLVYQGKDIVFRFIIKYSSLMDFAPLVGLI
jgi:hypothetical protein